MESMIVEYRMKVQFNDGGFVTTALAQARSLQEIKVQCDAWEETLHQTYPDRIWSEPSVIMSIPVEG